MGGGYLKWLLDGKSSTNPDCEVIYEPYFDLGHGIINIISIQLKDPLLFSPVKSQFGRAEGIQVL